MVIKDGRDNFLSKYFCSGCGICIVACKEKAITLNKDTKGFSPRIDKKTCTQCGLCPKICPILQGLVDSSFTLKDIKEYTASDLLGDYIASYVGYCTDDEVRRWASSGGIVTTLLIYMLKLDLIDGAVVVVQNSKFKSTCDLFTSKIARTKNEMLEAQGCKYIQVSMEDALEEIRRDPSLQRIAYVGTGCQIRALKRNIDKISGMQDRIFYYLGLFCKQNKIPDFTNYLLEIVHENFLNLSELSYRGNGWPGGFSINKNKRLSFKNWKYGYFPWYLNAYGCNACLSCSDCTAEEADISFGDAWLPQYEGKADNLGYSVLLTRSEFGADLIQKAAGEKILAIEKIDPLLVPKSQTVQKIIIKKSSLSIFGWILNRKAKITALENIFSNKKPSIIGLLFGLNYLFWSYFFSGRIFRKTIIYFEHFAHLCFRLVMKWNRIFELIYLTKYRIKKRNRK